MAMMDYSFPRFCGCGSETDVTWPTVTVTFDGAETVANQIEGGTWVEVSRNIYTSNRTVGNNTYVTYRNVVDNHWGIVQHVTGEWRAEVQRRCDLPNFGTNSIYYNYTFYPQEDAATREERIKKENRQRMREVIKSRCFPGILIEGADRKPLPTAPDHREQAARETLRRVIGEDQWRRFAKNGFIQVRAKSGRYYQIFPGHGMTKVFENGQLIQRLCIVLTEGFPATDSVIMRYLMVLNNEEDFWNRSVKHTSYQYIDNSSQNESASLKTAPLPEIAKLIRVA